MKRLLSLLFLLTALAGYSQETNPWHRGEGEFEYEYEYLQGKTITVYFYIPTKGDVASMRVLFAMHGADRDGKINRFIWKDFAEADGFVVIAPEYAKPQFTENDYQFGGVYSPEGELNPREQWTYNSVEAIFDLFCKWTGSKASLYDMWGHSAGGQFTHRFALAMPAARLATAVAANPGSWTFPVEENFNGRLNETCGWPYSVHGTPFANEEILKKFFSRKLVVHLGNLDTETSGAHVPDDEAALSQGRHRFERGRNFYKESQALAKRMGAEFNWKKVEVEGIGHAGRGMVYGRYRLVNGKREYSIDYITRTGAYNILYR